MSRHRNVKSLKIADERDGFDDEYGTSFEDNYCVSPGTLAMYTFNPNTGPSLSSYMTQQPDDPIQEEDEYDKEDQHGSLNEFKHPPLSEVEEAQLHSCLEEMHSILGDSTPEHVLVDAVLKHNFDYEKALSAVLALQDAPKPQRQRKPRDQNIYDKSIRDKNSHILVNDTHPFENPSMIKGTQVGPPNTLTLSAIAQAANREIVSTYDLEDVPRSARACETDMDRAVSLSRQAKATNPPKTVSLSKLAEANNSPCSTLLSDLAKASNPPKVVSLSELALAYHTPPTASLSAPTTGDDPPKNISLSELAKANNSPQTVSLTALTKANNPPKNISLSELAKANNPPRSISLSDLAKANKSSQDGVSPSLAKTPNPPHSVPSLSKLANFDSNKVASITSVTNKSMDSKFYGNSQSNLQGQMTSLGDLAETHLQCGNPNISDTQYPVENDEKLYTNKAEKRSLPAMSLSAMASVHHSLSANGPPLPKVAKQNSSKVECCLSGTQVALSRTGQISQDGISLSTLAEVHLESRDSLNTKQESLGDRAVQAMDTSGDAMDPSSPMKKLTLSSVNASNLGDLSKLAEEHSSKIHSSTFKLPKKLKDSPVCVSIKGPSMFGSTLCSQMKCVTSKKSNFSYAAQLKLSKKKKVHIETNYIKPFDFSTPSPDDIILERQKSAFNRNGPRKSPLTATTTITSNKGEASQVGFSGPQGGTFQFAGSSEVSDISTGVAKMTVASGKATHSGFTPTKDDDTPPQFDSPLAERAKSNLSAKMQDFTSNGMDGDSSSRNKFLKPKRNDERSRSSSPAAKPSAKSMKDKIAAKKEFEKRKAGGKDMLNLVVIGHVDAGKSTLMGHVLFQLGFVNKRTMHKYEQESKKLGKASFAYAWVLDETEEERARGVTMDVAQTRFETKTKIVTLLDAPGHKDFIPNMITGAAQADVAILVVNATVGEFETGFETGGQTREHAMLIRSLGVSQLVVAVNKMDTVDWYEERYKEITGKLRTFLKQTGFKEADVTYVPCSGLSGENLTKLSQVPHLTEWYSGKTLVDAIDNFRSPERMVDKPLRICVGDVFKSMGSGISISGTINSGILQSGDKVVVMPHGENAVVKSILIDEETTNYAFAGDNPIITLTGIDPSTISVGSIVCEPSSPVPIASRMTARVVIFNIDIPITKGVPVVYHYNSLSETAIIKKLVSQLQKSTGEVIRQKPRCLTKNSNAVIEIEVSRPVCVELYKDFKDLGRFMLRSAGVTIAAGLVTEIHPKKIKGDS